MLSQTTTLFAFEFSKPCRLLRQFSKNNNYKENNDDDDDFWNDYDDYETSSKKM